MRSAASFILAATLLLQNGALGQLTRQPAWSVCDQFYAGECRNSGAYHEDIYNVGRGPTGASVSGLWQVFASGHHNESSGVAQFLFQKEFGTYHLLNITELGGPVQYIQRFGPEDWRTPAVTLSAQPELVTHLPHTLTESAGSRDDCLLAGETVNSFAIQGSERWQFVDQSGSTFCVQVEDTTSGIPGVVRGLDMLGLPKRVGNLCAVIRGCDLPVEMVIKVPNYETTGILRR